MPGKSGLHRTMSRVFSNRLVRLLLPKLEFDKALDHSMLNGAESILRSRRKRKRKRASRGSPRLHGIEVIDLTGN